jgi:hypothetical protein
MKLISQVIRLYLPGLTLSQILVILGSVLVLWRMLMKKIFGSRYLDKKEKHRYEQ